MARLHRLFGQARQLGSLIDPEAGGGDLLSAGYDDLKRLLDAAIGRERKGAGRDERVVAAAGMARAAEILTGRYTLVVTNVPFLARGKQGTRLREFAETHHGDAKGDIATVFASRIFPWLGDHGTQALVTPQGWLFLPRYRKLRERLLKEQTWNVVARLGPGAFETISGEVVNVALVVLSAGTPEPGLGDGRDRCVGSARAAADSRRREGPAAGGWGGGDRVGSSRTVEKSGCACPTCHH